MSFTDLFGAGDQATVVVALISLMGVSLSIAIAMAIAINYLDEPVASNRQIVVTAIVVLLGFCAIVIWPEDEPIESLASIQRKPIHSATGLVSKEHPLLVYCASCVTRSP